MANYSGNYYVNTTYTTNGDGTAATEAASAGGAGAWLSINDFWGVHTLTGAVTLHCTGGLDTATGYLDVADFSGMSATNTLTIQCDDDLGSAFDDGYHIYRTSGGAWSFFKFASYVHLQNIRMHAKSNDTYNVRMLRIDSGSTNVTADRCWFKAGIGGSNQELFEASGAGNGATIGPFDNCIFEMYDASGSASGGSAVLFGWSSVTCTFTKCLFTTEGMGTGCGRQSSGGTLTFEGCVSVNNSTDFSEAGTFTYNYTGASTAPSGGSGNFATSTTWTDDFEDGANSDFRPKSTGTLIDKITSTGSAGEAFDITGAARSGNWDAGPFELAAAGGGGFTDRGIGRGIMRGAGRGI